MDPSLLKSIDEVHQHIIECAHKILSTLIDANHLDSSLGKEMLLYAKQLLKLLPEVSCPEWLREILNKFDGKEIRQNVGGNCSAEFVSFLLLNFNAIELRILTPDQLNYDFDRVFDDVREAEGIPEVFDRLVEMLERIIAADLIDSRVVQEALERLMALFNRNKHGSLTSILVSLHYGRFALKAFGGALAANKYLKPMLDAFKEEFSIAETKIIRAEDTLKEEAIRRLTNRERLDAYLEKNDDAASSVAGYLGDSRGPTT